METKVFASPDGRHEIRLIYEFEIRFGPSYFRAEINGRMIRKTVFGGKCLWDPGSRYAALEKWNTTDEGRGPDTSLYLIDVENRKFYSTPRARGGFFRLVGFERNRVVYQKIYYGGGLVKKYEVGIPEINSWEKIAFRRFWNRS